jgi:hypothetical protein
MCVRTRCCFLQFEDTFKSSFRNKNRIRSRRSAYKTRAPPASTSSSKTPLHNHHPLCPLIFRCFASTRRGLFTFFFGGGGCGCSLSSSASPSSCLIIAMRTQLLSSTATTTRRSEDEHTTTTSEEESKRTPWWKQSNGGYYDEGGDGYDDEETRINNHIYCL